MTLGKVLGVLVAAFLVFFIVTSPDNAAKITHATWHGLVNTAHGVSTFVSRL